MLTDEVTIKIIAGKGGNGAVSFRREKYVPKGGPDGGDGGDGGNIFLICSNNVHTLADYDRKKVWQAKNGENGRSKRQKGKNGDDLELRIPPGTIIKYQKIDPKSQNEEMEEIIDMTKIGERVLIAKGGRGGWGNVHFATATHQTPTEAKPGTLGEAKSLEMELKLLADIGIIGLPNSGKSTLLSRVSNAKPKIADYPFTTLEPNLGVMNIYDKQMVLADIPGLIEGASKGRGLGHKFLKHIERTRLLIHLIDINSSDIVRDYNVIRQELGEWSKKLLGKKEIVVLSKIDTTDARESKKIAQEISLKIKKPVVLLSAVSGAGMKDLENSLIN